MLNLRHLSLFLKDCVKSCKMINNMPHFNEHALELSIMELFQQEGLHIHKRRRNP